MSVTTNLKLGFGKCKLALCVPEEHAAAPLSAYVGARVVTSFPNIARRYFEPLDAAATANAGAPVQTRIKELSGSVEASCGLGLADAIIDLVETGTTMRAAGLTMKATIMETESVLISNPQTKHPELVQRIVDRIQGYMDATKFQLVQYNAPRASLTECLKITPGKKSPSIMPLEQADWVAVSSLVLKKVRRRGMGRIPPPPPPPPPPTHPHRLKRVPQSWPRLPCVTGRLIAIRA